MTCTKNFPTLYLVYTHLYLRKFLRENLKTASYVKEVQEIVDSLHYMETEQKNHIIYTTN